jgi:hypothetical protein
MGLKVRNGFGEKDLTAAVGTALRRRSTKRNCEDCGVTVKTFRDLRLSVVGASICLCFDRVVDQRIARTCARSCLSVYFTMF